MSYEIRTGDMHQQVSSLTSTAAASPVQNKESTPAGNGTAPAADQANLSSLGGLVSQALGTSDVRTDKVAALQQAISSGQYNVSSSDVADKLVQSLLEKS